MNELIGHCGLDCEKCDARIATVNNDNELRRKVAKQWSELNNVDITPEMINCLGCRADGPKTVFCERLCQIRQCAMQNRAETCASCADMNTCAKLAAVTSNNAEALRNLIGEKSIKLTVYSSPLCPDCRECEVNFKAHGIEYENVDITASMKNLKAFLRLRDSLEVFEPCKSGGSVGIPAIVCEDGEVTLDWEGFLARKGLPVVYREQRASCSIEGKGC